MIVEDSAVVREHLRRIIGADPRLTVAGMATSGEEAIAMLDSVAPDVISMDIQLPGIEGFEATRRIMASRPTPIVVVSGIGIAEVNLSMEALKAGALGVVQKPVSSRHEDYDAMASRLCTQLAIMSDVRVIRRRDIGGKKIATVDARPTANLSSNGSKSYRVLAVAASTGGPNALLQLLSGLGEEFPLPIAIVQHMTPGFMEGFGEWLESVTPFRAVLVNEAMGLSPGTVFLAPSGKHLVLTATTASPDDRPPVGNQRPSANVLFSSLAKSCAEETIGVLLTGMGEDGASGLAELRAAGGFTIAEDETTAVVYGMPAAGVRLGAVVESYPIHAIASRILDLAGSRRGAKK